MRRMRCQADEETGSRIEEAAGDTILLGGA
jgi:hypothetical protein